MAAAPMGLCLMGPRAFAQTAATQEQNADLHDRVAALEAAEAGDAARADWAGLQCGPGETTTVTVYGLMRSEAVFDTDPA